jgi:nucleoporin NUP82
MPPHRSVQVGQFYHASKTSAPIVRVEWHPWGEAGSTLLVMTIDGKMRFQPFYGVDTCKLIQHYREYDISVNVEEPQQVLSFVPKRKAKSYLAEDASEREVAGLTLGKGKADWGPLTMYAVMRSGDIYAICPYMPQNTQVI